MVVIYCYPEIKKDKDCKFHLNNSFYFELSAALQ